MLKPPSSFAFAIGIAALVVGCGRSFTPPAAAPPPPLLWVEEGIERAGMKISLGYRGATATVDRSVEPVAAITHNGEPVAGAMVFTSLVRGGSDATNREPTTDEVATVYEPAGEQTPALYASGKLHLPDGQSPHAVRFRIVLPGADEDFMREISLP
jgi:hypothetical protein